MHGKQAQRGLRLHCIEFHFLINNLVEGAHPPPQLPHRRTASYIHSPTRRPAGARTRPPDPPPLLPSPRPPVCPCGPHLRVPVSVGSAVLAARADWRREPPANLLAAWPLHLFKQQAAGEAASHGTGLLQLQLEKGRRQNQVVYRSSRSPPLILAVNLS